MPTVHASATPTSDQLTPLTYSLFGMDPPSTNCRLALMTTETGWWLANHSNHAGMVEVGTNAELANTRGKMIGKIAAWAASGVDARSPMMAATQLNA